MPDGYSEAIEHAYSLLPAGIEGRLRGTHFFCGADPVMAGLSPREAGKDGRSYRDTAHVLSPHHLLHRPPADRRATVVIPSLEPYSRMETRDRRSAPGMIVHELGHVLHAQLGWRPKPWAVTTYGMRDRYESFAEFFAAWLVPGYLEWGDPRTVRAHALAWSPRTLKLLEDLAA